MKLVKTLLRKPDLNLANIASNVTARLSGIVLSLAAVPLLIKHLGFEAYGIIGFYNVVIGLTALLEMGLPLAINRAVARFSNTSEDGSDISRLIRSFEIILGSGSFLLMLLWALSTSLIAQYWLSSDEGSSLDIVGPLLAIGVLVSVRFPIGLYTSVLGGLQRQVIMNVLIILFSWLRICIPVFAIVFLSADLLLFFKIQIAVSVVELFMIRYVAWGSNPKFDRKASFSLDIVFREGRLAVNIGFMALIAIVIGQLDKILASGMLSLELFGLYSIAAMFGLVLMTAGYPFSSAVFPQFSAAFETLDYIRIKKLFGSYMSVFTVCLFALTAPLLMHTAEILKIYLQLDSISSDLVTTTQLFIIGGGFAGLLCIPNSIIIASGRLVSLNRFYAISILLYPGLLYFLIDTLNVVGAALSFAVYQATVFFAVLLISNKLAKFEKFISNIFIYLVLPVVMSFCALMFVDGLFYKYDFNVGVITEVSLKVISVFCILAVVFMSMGSDFMKNKLNT